MAVVVQEERVAEAEKRRALREELLEAKGAVRVLCRVRPPLPGESTAAPAAVQCLPGLGEIDVFAGRCGPPRLCSLPRDTGVGRIGEPTLVVTDGWAVRRRACDRRSETMVFQRMAAGVLGWGGVAASLACHRTCGLREPVCWQGWASREPSVGQWGGVRASVQACWALHLWWSITSCLL